MPHFCTCTVLLQLPTWCTAPPQVKGVKADEGQLLLRSGCFLQPAVCVNTANHIIRRQ